MINRSVKRISLRALIVDDELGSATAEGRAARALVAELQGRQIDVVEALSCAAGVVASRSRAAACIVALWTATICATSKASVGSAGASPRTNDKVPLSSSAVSLVPVLEMCTSCSKTVPANLRSVVPSALAHRTAAIA